MDTSKIIIGTVGGGRYTVTSPIVKEDYGLYLKIEGLELPATYEVDFSNSEHNGTSVTMIGNSDGVLIPSQFISSGKDIFAFLYHVGEDFGRTVYKFRIPNKLRPDRTNEQPTPEQQSVIDQTISELNDAVDRAEDAQEAIENMSVSAQTLAEGESATVTKSEQEGAVHLAFGIPKGATGDTPTIMASKTGKTTSIYVDGSEVAQIEDGTDGKDGKDGVDGDDGISPTVSVSPVTGGHEVTITDKDGDHSFDVMDGTDGGGMVVNATLVSGTQYTIDSTYDDIKTALSAGKTVVVMTQGVPQPYVGNVQLYNEWYLAFGVSTIYDNIATLTGFMIPETYQNVAIWTAQNTTIPTLSDVQINGTSIVEDGVANVPLGTTNRVGAMKASLNGGTSALNDGSIILSPANWLHMKKANAQYAPVTAKYIANAAFYGLCQAAGDTTQNTETSDSVNSLGNYTESAKSAISEMLGGSVSVSGTTPTINAKSGIRYVCGEVATLDFTPSASGICDVVFTSGSTPTVVTLPSTVKFPDGAFTAEADTTYEINILDGIYGAVMSWT